MFYVLIFSSFKAFMFLFCHALVKNECKCGQDNFDLNGILRASIYFFLNRFTC